MRFTPDRDNVLREYKFAVITETDEDYDPPVSKRKRAPYQGYYHKAQIIVVETTGGNTGIEVGTWGKPHKVGCQAVECGTLQEAINVSYAVADGTHGEEVRREKAYHIRKKVRKFRHKA